MSNSTWRLADLMRLSHPKGVDRRVGNLILRGEVDAAAPTVLHGFKAMQKAGSVKDVIKVLDQFKNLPWETIPTQFLNDPQVWRTLFYNGALGQTALLRNVTRFAKNGAFADLKFVGDVAKALADSERIEKGRVHPIAYANALGIYQNGKVVPGDGWYIKRQKDWTTNAKIAGALEAGFYAAFGNVEPSNKRMRLSVDTSASMTWHGPAGLVGMDCREAAAAMAMVLLRTEPYVEIVGFGSEMQVTNISDTDSLATVQKKIARLPASDTNLSLPMTSALATKSEIDTFVILTDNEVNGGEMKPSQALVKYRKAMGRDARLAVVGMVASAFTIADPQDKGTMDFVGFDSEAPRVLTDFSAGRI